MLAEATPSIREYYSRSDFLRPQGCDSHLTCGSSASGNYRPTCILCGEVKGHPDNFSWTLLRGAVGGCSITTGLLPEQVLSDPQSAPVCEASFGRVSGHEIGHSEADTEVIDALAFRLRRRICDVRV